ncbi:MAG: hypothetical protein AAGM84_04320 [Pseudomonadota bacterium]
MRNGAEEAGLAQVRVELRAGNTRAAMLAAEAMAPLAPLSPDLLLLRAECAIADGDAGKSIGLLDQALMVRDSATLWAAKGRALTALDEWARAALCFQRADALSPASFGAEASEVLRRAGRPKDAVSMAARAADPVALAAALMDSGDAGAAEDTLIGAGLQTPGAMALLARWRAEHMPVEQALAAASQIEFSLLGGPDRQALAQMLPADRMIEATAILHEGTQTGTAAQVASCHHALGRIAIAKGITERARAHFNAAHDIGGAAGHPAARDLITNASRMLHLTIPLCRLPRQGPMPILISGADTRRCSALAQIISGADKASLPRPLPGLVAVLVTLMRRLAHTAMHSISADEVIQISADLHRTLRESAGNAEVAIVTDPSLTRWLPLLVRTLPRARFMHITDRTANAARTLECAHPSHGVISAPREAMDLAILCDRLAGRAQTLAPERVCILSAEALAQPSADLRRAVLGFAGIGPTSQKHVRQHAA